MNGGHFEQRQHGALPAVLLLVFRRPEQTRRVFESVRRAKPSRLYVAADGPRPDRPGEAALCEEARRIATNVDWPCTVRTLFRDHNLGCRMGVSTALDWLFEHEKEGVVLEDDCVASSSFFPYCAELLERYRDDERVMCISGDNFQRGRSVTPYSYYFSRYMHCWGWATWRRAWRLYDRNMELWPEFRDSGGLRAWSDGDEGFVRYWQATLDVAAAGKVDSWAYRFLFTCWANSGLTCLPARNLVSNIGYGEDATHTRGSGETMPAEELELPLQHPPAICRHSGADKYEQQNVYGIADKPRLRALVRRAVRDSMPGPLLKSVRRFRAELQR
jgi:hypothetical protein